MPILLWDASTLLKRYQAELGTEAVNALFEAKPPPPMPGTVGGMPGMVTGL